MSRMYIPDPELRAQLEKEEQMYHRIMQDGRRDSNGCLVEPPADMTAEEEAYYRRLLQERGGRIQYTV